MAIRRDLPRGVKRITYLGQGPQSKERLAKATPVKLGKPQRAAPTVAQPDESITPQRSEVPVLGPLPTSHGVVITHIHADGKVHRTQADEFVEIQNRGKVPVDLSGWRISAGNVGQDFHFPARTLIRPQQLFRVYTDEIHPETGGFSFGSKRAIWNDKGDVGILFDQGGSEVSRWAYGLKAQAPSDS